MVLNWANFSLADLVRSIRRTATKLYLWSKKLRSTCSGNIRPLRRTLTFVQLRTGFNWANSCFANIVRVLRSPATKLYSGSKKLRSTCSGNIRPIRRTLPLIGWERRALLWMKIKMDDGVARFFTRFGGNLFICWLVGGAALSLGPRII